MYMSSRKPADILAHDRLQHTATNSHNIFEGALFHFHNTSEPRRKRLPLSILLSISTSYRVM